MKSNFLRKLLAVSLCAAIVGGTAVSLPVFVTDSGITANAVDTLTYGDFQYSIVNDKISITKYTGSEGTVTIPSVINGKSVTSIGKNAFRACSSIANITIPSSVTSVGDYAFYGCNILAGITIPEGVTSIGDNAFHGCTSLAGITIPEGVKSIGDYAFANCSNLAEIAIPSGVTSISDHAFVNCTSLAEIVIPSGVTSIGGNAFHGCTSLAGITIPEGVKSIGDYAFANCSNLAKIAIPSGVTSIGDYAFYKCNSLTSLAIPDSVTNIRKSAFEYCTSLSKITLSKKMTSIGSKSFHNCTSLADITIPDGVVSIGDCAFQNCTSLADVTVPNSVISIGINAFQGCTGLSKITLSKNLTGIGDYVFNGCKGLTNVTIPDSVTSIGECAFYNCTGITSLTIKDGVTNIADRAFQNCTSLSKIILSKNLTGIGDYVFYGCKGLTNVTIPDSVTSIGKYAFYNCNSLTSLAIPDSITSIGNSMFSGCTNLAEVSIPSSVTSIGDFAFMGCSSMMSITIPDSVVSIGKYAFYTCKSLTSVTVPDNVKGIGENAFGYYYNGVSARKLSGFKLYGTADSASETYAKDNEIEFVDISKVEVSGIELDKQSVTLETDESAVLTATVTPDNATDKTVTWISSNTSVATVSDGKVTAVSAGTTTITALASNGKTAICMVTVKEPAQTTELKNNSEISSASVTANTEITLSGKAEGGTEPYNFAYYYKKSTDSAWTKIAAYSTATSKTFKPVTAGTYTARVNVKDKEGTTVYKDFTVTVKASETTALTNNSTISTTSVTANSEVTMNGKATGGTEPYKFAYYYKKSTDSAWTKAYVTASGSAYTKNTTIKFKPTTAGTYNVKINAKDQGGTGTMVSKEFTVTVKSASTALTNKSTISATSVTAGTKITMNGKATGGTEPYKFAYYYKKSTDSSWTRAYITASGSAYTRNTEITFKPTTAGTYNVKINAKDQDGTGTMVSKEFTVKVTADSAALTNSSTVSATSVTVGTKITLSAKASGGTAPYKYAYYYKKSTDSSYSKLVMEDGSAYVESDTTKFTPKTAGTYCVRINVKDKDGAGTAVSKDFTITVK